jgi:hypothetical protein
MRRRFGYIPFVADPPLKFVAGVPILDRRKAALRPPESCLE